MIEPRKTNHRGVDPQDEQLNDGEILYACPACGVVVSNQEPAEMRLHHLHVIHSVEPKQAVEAFVNRMAAERAENDLHKERHARLGDAPRFALRSR